MFAFFIFIITIILKIFLFSLNILKHFLQPLMVLSNIYIFYLRFLIIVVNSINIAQSEHQSRYF